MFHSHRKRETRDKTRVISYSQNMFYIYMPVNTTKRKTKGKQNSTRSASPPTTRFASPPTTRSASAFKTPAPKTRKKKHAFTPTNNRNNRTRKPKRNNFATPTPTKSRNTPNASNTGNLNANFGRDISQFVITENKTTYPRLFYRSTGKGNGRFDKHFVGALVPFYGVKDDGTLIKAVMKREGRNTLFEWQKDLLKILKSDNTIETDSFVAFTTFLDNYINTPGELYVSSTAEPALFRFAQVPISEYFWEKESNAPLRHSIVSYLRNINIHHDNTNIPPETSFVFNPESIGLGTPKRSHWNEAQYFKLQKASPVKPRKKTN
jgi:hypothetical protein